MQISTRRAEHRKVFRAVGRRAELNEMSIERYFEQSDTPAAGSPVGVMMVRVLAKNPSMSFEDALAQAKSLPRQAAGRNDHHDIGRRELKLLRVGHYPVVHLQKRMREIRDAQ
jgi:hypothetical protein